MAVQAVSRHNGRRRVGVLGFTLLVLIAQTLVACGALPLSTSKPEESRRSPLARRSLAPARKKVLALPRKSQQASGAWDATIFVANLKKKRIYSAFANALETTGYLDILKQIVGSYSVTVLVPTNNRVAPSALQSRYIRQRLGFHILVGKWEARQLSSAFEGAQFLTLDNYPRTLNVFAYRVGEGDPAKFDKLPAGRGLGKIVDPNFYTTDKIIAHGIDGFLEPYRYFG